jgi:hypothetical protein
MGLGVVKGRFLGSKKAKVIRSGSDNIVCKRVRLEILSELAVIRVGKAKSSSGKKIDVSIVSGVYIRTKIDY